MLNIFVKVLLVLATIAISTIVLEYMHTNFRWFVFSGDAIFRYRLTVTVNVDGKDVSGSAVQQIHEYSTFGDGKGGIASGGTNLIGQAVVITLPGRPDMVVTMHYHSDSGYAAHIESVCGFLSGGVTSEAVVTARMNAFGGTCDLNEDSLPLILAVPNTGGVGAILPVDPHDMAGALGSAVSFKSAKIVKDDGPISYDIESRHPWVVWRGQSSVATVELLRSITGEQVLDSAFATAFYK